MRLNLNVPVRVRLTEQGAFLYNSYWRSSGVPLDLLSPMKQAGDELKIQLWEAMHIFGPHCYNGCRVPFVDNVIELPDAAA